MLRRWVGWGCCEGKPRGDVEMVGWVGWGEGGLSGDVGGWGEGGLSEGVRKGGLRSYMKMWDDSVSIGCVDMMC